MLREVVKVGEARKRVIASGGCAEEGVGRHHRGARAQLL